MRAVPWVRQPQFAARPSGTFVPTYFWTPQGGRTLLGPKLIGADVYGGTSKATPSGLAINNAGGTVYEAFPIDEPTRFPVLIAGSFIARDTNGLQAAVGMGDSTLDSGGLYGFVGQYTTNRVSGAIRVGQGGADAAIDGPVVEVGKQYNAVYIARGSNDQVLWVNGVAYTNPAVQLLDAASWGHFSIGGTRRATDLPFPSTADVLMGFAHFGSDPGDQWLRAWSINPNIVFAPLTRRLWAPTAPAASGSAGSFVRRVPWTRQPQGAAQLNWAHPLLANVEFVLLGSSSYWNPTKKSITQVGAPRLVATPKGVGPVYSETESLNYPAAASSGDAQPWTIAAVVTTVAVPAYSSSAAAIAGNFESGNVGVHDRSLTIVDSVGYAAYVFDGAAKYAQTTAPLELNKPETIVVSCSTSSLTCWVAGYPEASTAVSNTGYTGYTDCRFGIGVADAALNSGVVVQLLLRINGKAWSQAERASFISNPWQIFAPLQQRYGFAAAAAIAPSGVGSFVRRVPRTLQPAVPRLNQASPLGRGLLFAWTATNPYTDLAGGFPLVGNTDFTNDFRVSSSARALRSTTTSLNWDSLIQGDYSAGSASQVRYDKPAPPLTLVGLGRVDPNGAVVNFNLLFHRGNGGGGESWSISLHQGTFNGVECSFQTSGGSAGFVPYGSSGADRDFDPTKKDYLITLAIGPTTFTLWVDNFFEFTGATPSGNFYYDQGGSAQRALMVGRGYGSNDGSSFISLALLYDRALTKAEHLALFTNPWQVFAPLQQRYGFAAAAAVTPSSAAVSYTVRKPWTQQPPTPQRLKSKYADPDAWAVFGNGGAGPSRYSATVEKTGNSAPFFRPGRDGLGMSGDLNTYHIAPRSPLAQIGTTWVMRFTGFPTSSGFAMGELDNATAYVEDLLIGSDDSYNASTGVLTITIRDASNNILRAYTGNVGINDGKAHTVVWTLESTTTFSCYVDGAQVTVLYALTGPLTNLQIGVMEFNPWICTRNLRGAAQIGSTDQCIHLLARFMKPFADKAAISANPWQLFEPLQTRYGFATAGASTGIPFLSLATVSSILATIATPRVTLTF